MGFGAGAQAPPSLLAAPQVSGILSLMQPLDAQEPIRYRRADRDAARRRMRQAVGYVAAAILLGSISGLSIPVDGETGWPRLFRRLGVRTASWHFPVMPWQLKPSDDAVAARYARSFGWYGPPRGLRHPRPPWQGLRPAWYQALEPPASSFRDVFLPLLGPDPLSVTPWLRFKATDRSLQPRSIEPIARLAHVPVMMYHDVVVGPKDVSFDHTLDQFERDLALIEQTGATPISLRQWWNYITRGDPLPDKPILLTFDDGYKSCYTLVYPRLKARGWPAVFFIVPPFVGVGPQTDWYHGKKDHLTWDEMAEMHATGLFEFQSHSMSHPYLTEKKADEVDYELRESKKILEAKLGAPVQFFCYPIGDRNERVIQAAKNAGYIAAFTMTTGGSADSPSIMEVNRYDGSILAQAVAASSGRMVIGAPPMRPEADLSQPIRFYRRMVDIGFGDIPICWVSGGRPTTVHADYRYGVPDVARRAGARAAINGGFFGMASIHATANAMIGPVMASLGSLRDEEVWRRRSIAEPRAVFVNRRYLPGSPRESERLGGRPLVLISPQALRFVPFDPRSMNSQVAMERLLPGVTDAFIGGAWLVQDGQALSRYEHDRYATGDHHDPRRRAWFGIDRAGRPIIGASPSSQSSQTMGECLVRLGVYHAVLLDSGFSSSLYYNGSIFVTGHSDAKPSRPVPHIILLMDPDQPATGATSSASSRLDSLLRWSRGDDQRRQLPPRTRLVDVDE